MHIKWVKSPLDLVDSLSYDHQQISLHFQTSSNVLRIHT